MFFIGGLDEAGLGPVLGPYTAFMIEFGFQTQPEKSLYQLLADSVSNEGNLPGKIWITDSKKIMGPHRDFSALENSVLSFLTAATGSCPPNFGEFLKITNCHKNDMPALENKPWYENIMMLPLPVNGGLSDIKKKSESLAKNFSFSGINRISITGRLVVEEEFNRLLETTSSKAQACQEILAPLLRSLSTNDGKLTIDRQGGRKFYGEWIVELFPGRRIQIRAETAGISLYRIDNLEMGFMVRADEAMLETATASLFSKYARECAMYCFNGYWTEKTGGKINPTAGYPLDGRRFIRALKEYGYMPENESLLVRKK